MLNKLRSFSKGKIASVLVAIIIVPFVFWGMGSVFSGGNTNSIAKINNINISAQDFMDHINKSRISTEIIKDNIDENILEELLAELVSTKLIDIEIIDQHIIISDDNLANRIKKNNSFQDTNNNFSRIKYEKFLLENNISAPEFEIRLRKKELKNNLFAYISGGVKSPYFFSNKTFINQSKKIEISYMNLNSIYKNKDQFNNSEIDQFINENEDKLKKEFIDFSYVKITPQNLIQETEFNENFFMKIDDIENLIANSYNLKKITEKYALKYNFVENFIDTNNDDSILKEIYLNRNKEKIQLIDKNDFFLLFEVDQIKKILPNRKDKKFITLVKNTLFEQNKYNYNKDLLINIQNGKFKNKDFINLSNNESLLQKVNIKSIKDDSIFSINSIKLLYSLPKSNFILMDDKESNIYIARIDNIINTNLVKNSDDLNIYKKQSKIIIKDNLYSSYDFLMNDKYKIKINQNTLERIKNYFR